MLAAAVVTVILVNRDSGGSGAGPKTTESSESAAVTAVVEGFMDAVIAGDVTKAKSFLCPSLADQAGSNLSDAPSITYEVHEPTITGDSAEVIVDVYEDGDVDAGLLKLDKTSDGWKICSVGSAPSSGPSPTS